MFLGALLRFARQVVAGVMSQMTQQLNIVQEQAYSPMRAMVEEVTGGIWIGQGADAFVQEVQSLMMPNTNQIMQNITKNHQDLQRAIDVLDRADQQAQQKINSLSEVFSGIFSG
jgi:peptidoglycan hydrolase CwlO-like protein